VYNRVQECGRPESVGDGSVSPQQQRTRTLIHGLINFLAWADAVVMGIVMYDDAVTGQLHCADNLLSFRLIPMGHISSSDNSATEVQPALGYSWSNAQLIMQLVWAPGGHDGIPER
jgi:hypothetical protein